MARYYLDEHIGNTLLAPLAYLGHDALSTHGAGNKGLTDPRQLLFATDQDRIMVTFNDQDYVMLHEMLVLSAARGALPAGRLHAGVALLPSTSRVAHALLVAALDELTREVDHTINRCFRWAPAFRWKEVIVPPYVSPRSLLE